jgi:predicted dehydrogenase
MIAMLRHEKKPGAIVGDTGCPREQSTVCDMSEWPKTNFLPPRKGADDMTKLAWGIIGTGNIAKAFAGGLAESETGELIAVGSRTQEAADRFGDAFNVERRYGSYDALLADPEVEVVYISTPHPVHGEWAIKAADAGKHILCEKPITVNYSDATAVIEAARRNDVFLMEAFMYRCHPQTERLVELIRDRMIGDVGIIQATMSGHCEFDLNGRVFNKALGGGAILDIGCYCTSMSRLIAGAALGLPFAEPMEVVAAGHIGEMSGVDEYTCALLRFNDDIIAQASTGVRLNQESVVRIYGTEGSILIPSPWLCSGNSGSSKIIVCKYGESDAREIVVESPAGLYTIEADTVAKYIDARQASAMTWADTLGNMQTMDAWRRAIGLVYDMEP